MNTSMTINATAAWMLALYVANAESQGVAADSFEARRRTTSSRSTCRAAPTSSRPRSRRLIVDMVAWCAQHAPKWNPINVCSYHLQRRGDAGAGDRLCAGDGDRGARCGARFRQVEPEQFAQVYGSISFFVNAGIRFVEEVCNFGRLAELWDRIGLERYGVADERARRFAMACRSTRSASPRPSREQRATDRAGDARSHVVEAGKSAVHPAARWNEAWACAHRGTSSGLRMQQVSGVRE
jgi:(2R)-ethylmalonyl-CoA mutase